MTGIPEAEQKRKVTLMSSLEDAIRRRAYELWEAEGRPEGRTDEFWYRAEEEVTTTNAPTAENPAARKRTASGTPATKKSSGKTTKSEGKATPASNAKPRAKTGARKTSSATGQATQGRLDQIHKQGEPVQENHHLG